MTVRWPPHHLALNRCILPVYHVCMLLACIAAATLRELTSTAPVIPGVLIWLTCSVDWPYDQKSCDWGAVLLHVHVRRCWVKIYSAVSFGEMPSSEIVRCMLWWSFGLSRWDWEPATECCDWRSSCPVPLSCFTFFSCHLDSAVGCLMNSMLITSNSSTNWYDDWYQTSLTIRCPTFDARAVCVSK